MKKVIFLVLVATVFFLSPANAQEKPNSGFLQEVKDAHAHGQKGRISRYLQSRETDDEGVYIEYGNYTVLGVKIWAIRIHESEGWQMKFSDGQYAYWNRNWGYLREGRVVWGYGDMPQFEVVNGFDRISSGVYDNYCSNHGGIQRPHIKVVEKTIYKREGKLLKIDGQKVGGTDDDGEELIFDQEVSSGGKLTGNPAIDVDIIDDAIKKETKKIKSPKMRKTWFLLGTKLPKGWSFVVDGTGLIASAFLAGDLITDGNIDLNWIKELSSPTGGGSNNGGSEPGYNDGSGD